MRTVRLLVCYLHCVCATSVNISTGTKDPFITENENAWWDARRDCQTEHERDLYIADKEPLPSALYGIPNNDTFYWVGAMRYSTWIWTADKSPLYSYVGYTVPGSEEEYNLTLPHNSVYACHLACKNTDTILGLGLKGNNCFCLNETYEATNTSAGDMQCQGNLDEKCGNSTGMSVYTLGAGHFEFTPTQDGACGYAVVNGSISVRLSHYRHCLTRRRRSACYQNTSQDINCNKSVSVSLQNNRQSWIQAYQNCCLVKLDNSTIKHLNVSRPTQRIWIGLAYKVSRKWINGNNANGYEDYYPFLNSPIQMCLALKTRRPRKFYWLPCSFHLAAICEAIPTLTSVPTPSSTQSSSSGVDASVPSTDDQSDVDGHADGWKGVVIGLSMGNVILLLIVIALVLLLQRQRKLRLDTKEICQQTIMKTSTENATCSPDVPRENGDYTYINPDTLDGKPFTHPALTTTVNPTSHIEKICNPVTDVEKETAPGLPAGAPYMHPHDYNTAEGVQPRGGDEGAVSLGPDASAAVTGVASSEGVQYFVLENHSSMQGGKGDAGLYEHLSMQGGKGDAGLYDHMETAKGLYDITQQRGNVRQGAESYSNIGAIQKAMEVGVYHVAHAGVVVTSLDDTYNHTFETNS